MGISSEISEQNQDRLTGSLKFFYLLYKESDEQSVIFELKSFDPVTEEIRVITQLSFPNSRDETVDVIDPKAIQYSGNKIFYHISDQGLLSLGKIYLFDLKTKEAKKVIDVTVEGSSRLITSYLIKDNLIFFLDCNNPKIKSEELLATSTNDCLLKQVSLDSPSEVVLLSNLKEIFKEVNSRKKLYFRDSQKDRIMIEELFIPNSYTVVDKGHMFEFSIADKKIKEILRYEGKDLDKAPLQTEELRCEELSSQSLVLQKEEKDVYPGRYELGCFEL